MIFDDLVFQSIIILKDGREIYFSNLYMFELKKIIEFFNSDIDQIDIRNYVESDENE